jgi:hypothetical protein
MFSVAGSFDYWFDESGFILEHYSNGDILNSDSRWPISKLISYIISYDPELLAILPKFSPLANLPPSRTLDLLLDAAKTLVSHATARGDQVAHKDYIVGWICPGYSTPVLYRMADSSARLCHTKCICKIEMEKYASERQRQEHSCSQSRPLDQRNPYFDPD